MEKLRTPVADSKKETRMRTEPIAHFRLALASSQTWDTISSSNPNMATTTAKDTMLLMGITPTLSPSTWASLRSVTHFRTLSLPRVQKCHSPKSCPLAKSQRPSQMEMDDKTTAMATHRMIRLLISVSKKDFCGLRCASSCCT